MPATSPLLFLDFDGVLVLQNASKTRQIAEALKTIGSGKGAIEEFQDLWPGLFERRARDYLKALHHEFQLTYCLTSPWAQWIDKPTMVKLLRLGGLEFVASRLHSRWEIAPPDQATSRYAAITHWLKLNGTNGAPWWVLDAESSGASQLDWPQEIQTRTIVCFRDVGLTDFESERLRQALKANSASGSTGHEH